MQRPAAGLAQLEIIGQRVAELPGQARNPYRRARSGAGNTRRGADGIAGSGAQLRLRSYRSHPGSWVRSSPAAACADSSSLPAASATSAARAVVDHDADGKGSSTSTWLSRSSTRWICGIGGAEIKPALLRFDRLPLGRPVAPPDHAGLPGQSHQEIPRVGMVEAERRVSQPGRCRGDHRTPKRLGAQARSPRRTEEALPALAQPGQALVPTAVRRQAQRSGAGLDAAIEEIRQFELPPTPRRFRSVSLKARSVKDRPAAALVKMFPACSVSIKDSTGRRGS